MTNQEFNSFVPLLGCQANAQQTSSALPRGRSPSCPSYRERMALAPDAIFEASIAEVSLTDASANLIAATEVKSPRTPIHFVLTYDGKEIRPDGRYVVHGRITVRRQVWFASDPDVRLPTGPGPHHVALLLRRAGGPARGVSLETTYWKLRTFHGITVKPVGPTR